MYHNVSQFTNGNAAPAAPRSSRMDGVMHIRVATPTIDGLRTIAIREGRTPSNLARKVITDFVRRTQMETAAV